MRRIWIISICMIVLCGCTQHSVYKIEEQEKSQIIITNDAYFMSGQTLDSIQKSNYEEAEVVYYAKDEMQLAKILQYAMDSGDDEIAYQSEQVLDLDQVANILSYVNPFDLSLTQDVVKYTNNKKEVLYISYHVKIENLDARYQESLQSAKHIKEQIAHEEMDTNEKIKELHDYIIQHTVYDVEAQESQDKHSGVFKASGVFADQRAVCTGYSRAFMMLAKEAGIPALYVSSESMNHSWNYVYDGQAWRYIDVTWDDPVPDRDGCADDRFLNVPKEMFLLDGTHSLSEDEQNMVEQIAENFF